MLVVRSMAKKKTTTRRRPNAGEIERRDLIFTADGLPEIDDSVLIRLGIPAEELNDPARRIQGFRILYAYFSAVEKGHKANQAKVKADTLPIMIGLDEDLKRKRLEVMELDRIRKSENLDWERKWKDKGFRTEKEALRDEQA